MKKQIFALAVLASFTMSATAFAARPTVVKVGGEEIESDVAPQIINNRTFVPLRAIFEALDIAVDYDAATKTITAKGADKTFELTIGSNIVKVNGEEKQIDAPAIIKDNRTLVPLRACAESFGFEVDWNDKTRVAKVKKGVWLVSKLDDASEDISYTFQYDNDGNMIYFESADGTWLKNEYDENGNRIYFINSRGEWDKSQFNEYGEEVYSEDSDGYWAKNQYDENGNIVYLEIGSKSDNIFWHKYQYDANNNLTYREFSDGSWQKYSYDDNGNLIRVDSSDAKWERYEYNDQGLMTYYENTGIGWEKYEYDENGNMLEKQNSSGYWDKYTYDEKVMKFIMNQKAVAA